MLVAILHTAVNAEASLEDQDVLVQAETVSAALRQLGHDCVTFGCGLDLAATRDRLRELRPDAVFNLVESIEGDDALAHVLPAVLDALGVPYTGNSAAATFLTTHKLLAKQRLQQASLPTPEWIETGTGTVPIFAPAKMGLSPSTPPSTAGTAVAHAGESPSTAETAVAHKSTWIIKGVWEQASRNLDEDAILADVDEPTLRAELQRRAARLARPCYAEAFVAGREFNVSVLDGPTRTGTGPQVLPPAEIDFSAFPPEKPRIVGYRAKWQADSFEYQNTPRRFDFPAADGPLLEQLRRLSLECWALFGLRGYARVDFRVDREGRPWILEINTNPCLSPDAGFAAALQQAGISFEEAIGRILAASV
jgi:D-alanine-D-alanine ligase